MKIQAYKNKLDWQTGDKLVADTVVTKENAHQLDLLHLSAHLILIDDDGNLCCRKRPIHDLRYAGLWTTTVGTHVPLKQDYKETLLALLPIEMELKWIGEFRVHDDWENEINGLYLGRAKEKELPVEFMIDRTFLAKKNLKKELEKKRATPHLAEAYKLLTK